MKQQKGISTTLSILLIVFLAVVVGGIVAYKYYLAPEKEPSVGEFPGEPQDGTAVTPATPIICVQENEIANIDSNQPCCQNLVKIQGGNGETEFTCATSNIKGAIVSIDSQNLKLSIKISSSDIRGWNSGEVVEIRATDQIPPIFFVTDYTVEPIETGGFENLKIGDSIEAWIETAVMGDYAHGINIILPMEEQVIRERIDEFMSERIKRNSEKVLSYLTEKVKLSYEHKDYAWLDYQEALNRLTFENSKEVLKKADDFLSEKSV